MKPLLFLIVIVTIISCTSKPVLLTQADVPISVPTKGNSWIEGINSRQDRSVLQNGLTDWNKLGTIAKTYFYVSETGNLNIGLKAKSNKDSGQLKATFNKKSTNIEITNDDFDLVPIGQFNIKSPGYYFLELAQEDGSNIDISDVLIGGPATKGKNYFAQEDFYWGRRGPSVHLTYQVPEAASDIVYFYNEINVPEGEDVLGSYFMANGFAEGYFGIQVNGADERRILFSVWSPFKTDNPDDIPADQRIKMPKKGKDVYTGEFGNEGSGGQSYRKYMWKSGNN